MFWAGSYEMFKIEIIIIKNHLRCLFSKGSTKHIGSGPMEASNGVEAGGKGTSWSGGDDVPSGANAVVNHSWSLPNNVNKDSC